MITKAYSFEDNIFETYEEAKEYIREKYAEKSFDKFDNWDNLEELANELTPNQMLKIIRPDVYEKKLEKYIEELECEIYQCDQVESTADYYTMYGLSERDFVTL